MTPFSSRSPALLAESLPSRRCCWHGGLYGVMAFAVASARRSLVYGCAGAQTGTSQLVFAEAWRSPWQGFWPALSLLVSDPIHGVVSLALPEQRAGFSSVAAVLHCVCHRMSSAARSATKVTQ